MKLVILILIVTLVGCIGSSEPRNPTSHCAHIDMSSVAEIDTQSTQTEPEPELKQPELSNPIY